MNPYFTILRADPSVLRLGAAELKTFGLNPSAFSDSQSGFFSALYKQETTGKYVLAFRGTQEFADWLLEGNIGQGLGLEADQYESAMRLALDTSDIIPSQNLMFTGHSLGGGLASATALRAGVDTVVFNPAGVHRKTLARYGIGLDRADALIAKYVVEGEILDDVQMVSGFWEHMNPVGGALGAAMPDSIGRDLRLKPNRLFLGIGVRLHLMPQVLGSKPIRRGAR